MFVSLSQQDAFRLDAVQIQIDGELATHHIYSFKELEALKSGGVQRIYTGNLTTGEHQLEVSRDRQARKRQGLPGEPAVHVQQGRGSPLARHRAGRSRERRSRRSNCKTGNHASARSLADRAAGARRRVGALVCRPTTKPRDLYFAEALYYAYQGHYFEALARLDAELAQHYGLDEPQLDSLYPFISTAEFSVGDFELNYRMHLRAGRAITAVLEGNVDEAVRNDAAFRLARIQFQKGQLADALHSLDRIHGRFPTRSATTSSSCARTSMSPSDARTTRRRFSSGCKARRRCAASPTTTSAIAYLLADHREAALEQLDKAGEVDAADEPTMAIRDKSNLVLGTLLFESADFVEAKRSLDRVRLAGPFSNQALLRAGWADASAKRYESALVPWNILASASRRTPPCRKRMLALPYAYSQLAVYGRAAVLYRQALESYGSGTRAS